MISKIIFLILIFSHVYAFGIENYPIVINGKMHLKSGRIYGMANESHYKIDGLIDKKNIIIEEGMQTAIIEYYLKFKIIFYAELDGNSIYRIIILNKMIPIIDNQRQIRIGDKISLYSEVYALKWITEGHEIGSSFLINSIKNTSFYTKCHLNEIIKKECRIDEIRIY
jgi:hypothetical protein